MISPESLKSCSHKDLAQMAKRTGVRGWHAMRKDQLLRALLAAARRESVKSRRAKPLPMPVRRGSPKSAVANGHAKVAVSRPTSPRVLKHIEQVKSKLARFKDLSLPENKSGQSRRSDRVVVMVRDSYWLHVYWELTRAGVERARAAMGEHWHTSRPVLRLLEVVDGGLTSATECLLRDVDIHGGISNWYLHVEQPSKSYRVEIGYLAAAGKFQALARSNVVTTPEPGSSDDVDQNWTDIAENFDKIFALSGGYSTDGNTLELQQVFEERLQRPMGSPMVTRFGVGAETLAAPRRDFPFEIDAEMIVYGATVPNAHVCLRGEPVKLRPDGTFTVRMALPNQRQVIPVVASAANGAQQQTIVLAIERNTKVMEPVVRESNE